MHLVTPAPGTFTNQELERLAVYRAAVAAGFYTDDVPGVATDAEAAETSEEEGHQPAEDVPSDTATPEPPAR
jgi:hypothetical protein